MGRFLSAACCFSFIFSSSFLIFTFPSYKFVFLILLSFLFFFFVICFFFRLFRLLFTVKITACATNIYLYVLSIYRINFGFLVLASLGHSKMPSSLRPSGNESDQ